MKRSMMKSLAVLAVFASVASSAFAGPRVSSIDTDGKRVTLASPAKRIVSLSPAATETLYAIGSGSKLRGVTTYCNYLEAAKALPKVGEFSAATISVEKILSLKPDLVVTAGMMHRELEPQFERLGIKFFSYDPADFAGIADGMRSLGILTGNSAEAEKAATAMLASIESTKKALSALKPEERPNVFWEMYDEPLMTCGASTFQHAIIEAAGGRDIFSDLPGAWPVVSAEEVIKRSPQAILGADDHQDRLTPSLVASRPGWASVPAVRTSRILLFPADLVSRPSPRIAEGILMVARALHPRLFP